ncbi:O-acetyl-ADP-ribose deacetylase [Gammaproteobacteria bacterium 53_120_T64]|nr:O-acetyl-ADP-ribose deacetylase [Gammaproteobacteria bacterium 53_120_T64]
MSKIEILATDITQLRVDAIVNAANNSLLGGGGVDAAIHAAAGPALLQACKVLQGCATGSAKITPGFALAAPYIIHTVGPVWRGGRQGEAQLLAACYRNSLKLASEQGLRSIAFPAISCGVYGYPIGAACEIAVAEVSHFMANHGGIEEVIFACFNGEVKTQLSQCLAKRQGPSS